MKMKNFIAGIVTLFYVAFALGITAFADGESTGVYEDTTNGYSLNYTVDTDAKTAEITGFTSEPASAVTMVIPETVTLNEEVYTVTSIKALAFGVTSGSKNTIATVDFPNTITSIGDSAFQRQASLKYFSTGGVKGKLPEGLTKLGYGAFANINNMEGDIVFPDSLKVIEGSIFYDVRNITSIKLGNAVESIGSFAFFRAYLVPELELPATLQKLDLTAFNRMAALQTLTVKSTAPIQLTIAVQNTEGIYGWSCTRTGTNQGGNIGGAVTRSDGTVGYTHFVFDDLNVLKSFANDCCVNANGFKDEECKKYFVSNNFIYNGVSTFSVGGYNCEGIGVIYEGTQTEDETTSAIINFATTVTGLTQPATESYEIDFTNGITDSDGNKYYVSKIADAVTVDGVTKGAFDGDDFVTKVKTGSAMTYLGSRAFNECDNLREVIIDEGLLTMGTRAFNNCDYLTKVSIPSTITKWNDASFMWCIRLTDLTFAEGLKTIGNEFYNCQALENVVIPASVEKLSYSVLSTKFIRNIVIKGETFPTIYDATSLSIGEGGNSVTVYVKNQTVADTANEKYGAVAANEGKYAVKLLSGCDAVADYFQWVGRGYKKGFVYAEQPVDATYYFVQYNDAADATEPIKQIFWKDVSLNAGEYTTFDVDTDGTEDAVVYVFLLDRNTLKPHINKTDFTLTKR